MKERYEKKNNEKEKEREREREKERERQNTVTYKSPKKNRNVFIVLNVFHAIGKSVSFFSLDVSFSLSLSLDNILRPLIYKCSR